MPTDRNKFAPTGILIRAAASKTVEIFDPETVGLRRVRGYSRNLVDRSGNVYKQNEHGTITLQPQHKDRDGYPRVTLRHISEVGKDHKETWPVHRLMLLCWVGPCPEGHEADHIDKDRANNKLENLRWLPVSENRKTAQFGRVFQRATFEERAEAVRLYRAGHGIAWIAETMKIGAGAVKRALVDAGVETRAASKPSPASMKSRAAAKAFVAGLIFWTALPYVVALGGGR